MKEIVIKISDRKLKSIQEGMYCGLLDVEMYDAIKEGTVLPEHHGRIADIDIIYQDICDSISQMTGIGVVVDGEYLWHKLNDAIDNADTILESTEEQK